MNLTQRKTNDLFYIDTKPIKSKTKWKYFLAVVFETELLEESTLFPSTVNYYESLSSFNTEKEAILYGSLVCDSLYAYLQFGYFTPDECKEFIYSIVSPKDCPSDIANKSYDDFLNFKEKIKEPRELLKKAGEEIEIKNKKLMN